MNNRIPIIALGALVLVTIIWKIANPTPPPVPGPTGQMPSWTSTLRVGDMTACAVSPDGTKWAGVWSKPAKGGSLESAVWIIDLNKQSAISHRLKGVKYNTCISWADDNTVRALYRNNSETAIAYIDASTGKQQRSQSLKCDFQNVIAYPAGSDKLVAQAPNSGANMELSVFSEKGDALDKKIAVSLPKDTNFGSVSALDKDGRQFIFSAGDGKGSFIYYLGNSQTGTVKPAFTLSQLPGKVEGVWISDAGVLVACSVFERCYRMIYNPTTGKLMEVKSAVDLKNWPDAPKSIMLVTFSGGYSFDLGSGKVTKLFDYTKLDRSEDSWRSNVNGGRLYPRKDGGYTSVSLTNGTIDIRTLNKDGLKPQDILTRN